MSQWDEDRWLATIRQQFPALQRRQGEVTAIYLDGAAGTQVPRSVVEAVSEAMLHHNANLGGTFDTSRECGALMENSASAFADFFGASSSREIVFGANATSLTMAMSRAIARTWQAGDEIVVTDLDHDANVTPWVLAARDRGITVRRVAVRPADCTLDLEDMWRQIGPRTRLVAVGGASNSVGTKNRVNEICRAAHLVGALVYVDAVHYAPHVLIDVAELGCDFLVCSAYKFFGPHVGVLWGRAELLESIEAYKVRPAPPEGPGKWMTGTQNHPCIAGSAAAVDYLARLARADSPERSSQPMSRREQLRRAFRWIEDYERRLMRQLLDGLEMLPQFQVVGIRDPARDHERLPTVSIRHESASPHRLSQFLADHGVFTWHGNYYALRLSELLGYEPQGMVRLGFVHYNTRDEVERTLQLLSKFR